MKTARLKMASLFGRAKDAAILPDAYPFKRLCDCPTYCGGACCIVPFRPGERGFVEDLKGMAIPAGGLPDCMAGFSMNGWTLQKDRTGNIIMVSTGKVENEDGCRDYMQADFAKIRECFCCLSGLPASCPGRGKS